jgi:hypothetical protein
MVAGQEQRQPAPTTEYQLLRAAVVGVPDLGLLAAAEYAEHIGTVTHHSPPPRTLAGRVAGRGGAGGSDALAAQAPESIAEPAFIVAPSTAAA